MRGALKPRHVHSQRYEDAQILLIYLDCKEYNNDDLKFRIRLCTHNQWIQKFLSFDLILKANELHPKYQLLVLRRYPGSRCSQYEKAEETHLLVDQKESKLHQRMLFSIFHCFRQGERLSPFPVLSGFLKIYEVARHF